MPLTDAKPVTFINTADRHESEIFYREIIGLPLVGDDGFAAVFDLSGAVLRITELQGFVASPHPVLGWSVNDLAATMQKLASRGVTPSIYEGLGQDEWGIWTSPDGTVRVAWFCDPDGNVLSVVQGG